VHRGALDDLDSLHRGAAAADGVIHLAFQFDISDFATPGQIDLRAVETMGAALKGTGSPLVITGHYNGEASENAAIALAGVGVRSSVVNLSPSVHGEGDKGFVPMLINIARMKGVSAYVGDGSNRWTAVHRLGGVRRPEVKCTDAGTLGMAACASRTDPRHRRALLQHLI
jgi:hypothetical protein